MMVSIKIDGMDYFYDDQKPLGEGSSFISYKAEDQKGRPTILKISKNNSITPVKETIIANGGGDYSINQVINKEYMKELYAVLYSEELVNKVCHFDYYSIDENIYVLQDYNFGDTLANFHFNYYEEVYEVAKSVISLTCKIHSKGWLILDLKPSNLLVVKIDEKLIVKLIDFDSLISKEKLHSDDLDQEIKTTVKYASPEIIKLKEFYDKQNYCIDMDECKEYKEKIDENSDLYSIGIILKNILSQNPNLGFISIVDDDEKRKIKMLFNRIIYTTKDNNEDKYYDKLSDINSCLYSMQQLFGNSYQNHIFDDKFNDYLNYKHDNQIIDYLLDELSSHVNKKIKPEYDSVALYDLDDLDDLDDLINIKCHICNKSYDIAKSSLEKMKKIFAFRQPRPLLLVHFLLVYVDIETKEFKLFNDEIKPEIDKEICKLLSLVEGSYAVFCGNQYMSFIYGYLKSLHLIKIGKYEKVATNIDFSKLSLTANVSYIPDDFANKGYYVNIEDVQISLKIAIQALFELAQCFEAASLYDEALDTLKSAMEDAALIYNEHLILKAEINVINCLQQQSKYDEAASYITNTLEKIDILLDEFGNSTECSLLAKIYSLAAINFHKLKDYNSAKKYAYSLLTIHSNENHKEFINLSFDKLLETGILFMEREDYTQATYYFQKAKLELTESVDPHDIFRLSFYLANSLHFCKKYEEAIENFDLTIFLANIFNLTNLQVELNSALSSIVTCYYHYGDYEGMILYLVNTLVDNKVTIDEETSKEIKKLFCNHKNSIVNSKDLSWTIDYIINKIKNKIIDLNITTIVDIILIIINTEGLRSHYSEFINQVRECGIDVDKFY